MNVVILQALGVSLHPEGCRQIYVNVSIFERAIFAYLTCATKSLCILCFASQERLVWVLEKQAQSKRIGKGNSFIMTFSVLFFKMYSKENLAEVLY
jgi:hypothetical protein